MDKRIITVKGKGSVTASPDIVSINLDIESKNYQYEKAMDVASKSIEGLELAVESLGFERKNLKTISFNVDTDYENYNDKTGNFKSKFVGYVVRQKLKLEFDFDSKILGEILKKISETSANPKLDIGFSVKDKMLIEEKLLVDSFENAKIKADILTKASGVELGELLKIDYDWSDLNIYSRAKISSDIKFSAISMPKIEPENIEVSDNVTLVWEIK